MPSNRSIMRIQLEASAKDRLDAICRKRGMTHIEAMSRLVAWFDKQDDVIHTSVLHNLSDGSLSTVAKMLLKKS
jgi:hypothetical protein